MVKDKVLVGTSGGDDGVRGFVAAFDAITGKEAWRFWTISGPGEFGNSSWPGDMYLHGGATTWMPGTYDPELNTVYWGTSNPSPDFDGSVRPGDDLYANCVLALDADTGKLKWHFQFTPTISSITMPLKRLSRRCDVQGDASKAIGRSESQRLSVRSRSHEWQVPSAVPFVKKLNWAKGIDANGRPIRTGVMPTANGTVICPDMRALQTGSLLLQPFHSIALLHGP